jgi:hypothetical protein
MTRVPKTGKAVKDKSKRKLSAAVLGFTLQSPLGSVDA